MMSPHASGFAPSFSWRAAWLAAGVVLAVHVLWVFIGPSPVLVGGLEDGDSYMRLLRVQRLLDTRGWFDGGFPRTNAPYGDTSHWTRLYDLVLLGVAAPLLPFMETVDALFAAAVAVGPVLHAATALVLAWAAAPLLGPAAPLAALFTAAQPGLVGYAAAGHADHHPLFALLAALAFGCLDRTLNGGPRRTASAGGLAVAAGLWVGPEAEVLFLLGTIAIGLPWLSGADWGARQGYAFAMGGLYGLVVTLLVERGAGFWDIEYDRISVVHLGLVLAVALFWRGVMAAEGRGWRPRLAGRLMAASLGAITAAVGLRLLFPGILRGPTADVPPEMLALIPVIAEFHSPGSLARFLILAGAVLVAGPYLAVRLRQEWAGPRRWAWLALALFVAAYVLLTTHWIRWSLYAGLFLAVPLAALVARIDVRLSRPATAGRSVLKVVLIIAAAAGPAAVGVALERLAGGTAGGPVARCDVKELTALLNGPPWNERPLTIAASANFGPEILYRTLHHVVATLYHRNAAGLADGRAILGGTDETRSRALTAVRGVDLLLLCPGSADDGYLAAGGAGSLYHRLLAGDLPAWLEAAPAAGGFRMFRTRHD
jgi:hypothetical protein